MNEMVERVAKAMFAAKPQNHTTWEQCDDGYRNTKRREARAAIEAMREPTNDMCNSGTRCLAVDWNMADGRIAPEVWDTMIEAALE